MKRTLSKVIYNRGISPSYHLLGLRWEGRIDPGQFFMLRPWSFDRFDPLLNRPFGVYRVFEGGIEILYKVVGRGTRIMTGLKEGDEVILIGPLGRGFPFMEGWEEVSIVSGGVGIAPFYHLIQWIREKGSFPALSLYHGGRGEEDLVGIEEFERAGVTVNIATERGTRGYRGLISDLFKRDLEKGKVRPSAVLSCGPKGMLKEVALICRERGIPCYVSLDRMMGCGIGTCLGCVVRTKGGYQRVCMEGPVFESEEIVWEEL